MGALELGNLFEKYRIKKNVSIQELSEDTGISKSVMYRILSGETKRPSLKNCKKIMNVLDIPLVSLINSYIMVTESPTTLQVLLSDAVTINHKELVIKITKKLLESPRMDSFLSLDYLLQFLRQVESTDIKLVLYDVIIDYSRQRGIPYYLSKTLFNRYQVERDDFSRFEETYHRAKEVLHYTNFLHPTERIFLYYRLGIHAYILGYFKECITLCSKGVFEDQADSKEKASALISMIYSYIRLGDLDLANSYLEQYEKSQYTDYRKKHLQALLFGKNQQYEEAVTLFKKCLKEAEPDVHISIVSDLLEVYLESGNNSMIENLIEQEDQFLSSKTIDHPYRIQLAARYYKRKGTCLLAINKIEEGSKSLMQSISFYRQLGASNQIVECTCILLKYHVQNETNLSFEHMELYGKICNNV